MPCVKYLKYFILFAVLAISQAGYSQIISTDSTENLGICDEDGYCNTRFSNSPRPKGISIIQQRYLSYDIETDEKGNSRKVREEIRRNRQTEFNLRFPVFLKDQYNLIVGLEYVEENFDFIGDKDLENQFHQLLQEEHLRTYQTKLYFNYKFKGPKFINTRTSFAFSGDLDGKDFKSSEYKDYYQFSFTGLYAVRKSVSKIIGIGAAYSYDFGNRNVFPVLYYNKQLTDKTGIELKLPAKIEYRYYPNKKNLFYGAIQLAGTSYVLDFPTGNSDKAYLNNGNVLGLITYEREIYDFFWITASAGYRYNARFNISNEDEFIQNADPFVENTLSGSPLIRLGIFIVPPRKLMGSM